MQGWPLELDKYLLTARDGLKQIFDTGKINDVIILLTPEDGQHVPGGPTTPLCNIHNLIEATVETGNMRVVFPAAEEFKKTIEFRYHEATLDVEEVGQWIRVCVCIADFAEQVRQEKVKTWLK